MLAAMNLERLKGCVGKLFLLGLMLVLVGALVLYMMRGGSRDAAQEKTGPLKEDQAKRPKGPMEIKELEKLAEKLRKDAKVLANGSTNVKQVVLWNIENDNIHFRIILTPYDREAHQLMMSPGEALFVSFESKAGVRVAPKAMPLRVEMRQLRMATENGAPAGWFVDGSVPVDAKDKNLVSAPRVGWLFSKQLHGRLRQLKAAAPAAVEIPPK